MNLQKKKNNKKSFRKIKEKEIIFDEHVTNILCHFSLSRTNS